MRRDGRRGMEDKRGDSLGDVGLVGKHSSKQ